MDLSDCFGFFNSSEIIITLNAKFSHVDIEVIHPARERMRYLISIIVSLSIISRTFLACSAPIAEGKEKFLGNVISFSVSSDFSDYWNQVTPENFGKWGNVEFIRDSMFWTPLKNAYEFAQKNGYIFKQHTFIWGQQEPPWIAKLSAEEQKEEIEEYIRLYAENFPNTDFADVVNEPLHTPPSYREAIGGAGSSGWDWVIWAFEKARQYLPNTRLLINEYDIVNSSKNTARYLEIINLLKERDLIDGIGVQSHCFTLQGTNTQVVKSNLDKLAATGLPLYCSEFDLQGDDQLQRSRYWQYFPIFWEHPAVKGVTIWGYRYKRTWIETTWLKDSSGAERPALIWLRDYVTTGERGVDSLPYYTRKIITHENCNYLQINSDKPLILELFRINGARVRSLSVNDHTRVPLSPLIPSNGIYVFRANSKDAIRLIFTGCRP